MLREELRSLLGLALAVALFSMLAAFGNSGSGSHSGQRTERILRTATSPQWRTPILRSWPSEEEHVRQGTLPVIAIDLPPGALFDPDSGIYVAGNAFLHGDDPSVARYPRDQHWWKYPGNYQFRGKQWERQARMRILEKDKGEMWSGDVGVRIHGNNTRGFPQHALRITFDHRIGIELFGHGDGIGHKAVVLRAGGNDQDRAFMRDVVQHRLCEGLAMETSASRACVLYVNGAYWGIHEIRERVDEKELARRHGMDKDDLSILADRALLYHGKKKEVARFMKVLGRLERMDSTGTALADSFSTYFDTDGFLRYMAAQMILGNNDWPDQNVKWWRYHGPRASEAGTVLASAYVREEHPSENVLDGRWRFIMGDSDLGMGMVMGADYDPFIHIQRKQGPVARLYRAAMRSAELRQRSREIMLSLLNGPLSEVRMQAVVDHVAAGLAAEMPLHIDRWRRPASPNAWATHVADLKTFAAQRGAIMRQMLDQHLPAQP